ncbi:ABC transporter substrate-binding protein [Nannocystis bainbridge]|uniref:ABC transporter substrate-binding protein n=1 Tax=Nannocystis bainbridge TaxID=2995303 RepID=A0ABT5EBI7_9BACT|nr:ABC transporter substrate-binding protein [Nannocystis bainbridge]MDC0722694.1 ABC transporter substrate-binding protein [Nannocystis bainbridge]
MSSVFSHLLVRFSVCGALGVIAGACSATLDFTECYDDADCASFFDDDKPMYCAGSVCQTREKGCDANSQCAGLGEAFICATSSAPRKCASTTSDECGAPIYPGGEVSDDVAFIGVMLPKTGADAELGEAMEKGVLAAVEEFNASGELPNGDKIALVVCDTKGEVASATSAARHLGDTLTIPVLIGPVDDLEFTAVVDQVTFAQGVNAFTMGPMVTADMTELDTTTGSGLVFQAMAGAKYQGPALGARIGADFTGDPTADAVLLLSEDAYGYGLYNAVATEDTSPKQIPQVPGSQFIASYRGLDDAAKGAKGKLDTALKTFPAPPMLILLGRSEVAEIIKHYKSTGAPLPQKIYVPKRAMPAVAALKDPELVDIVVAIAPELDTPQLAKLRTRLGESDLAPEAALAYDATMASLFGMAAVKADIIVGLRVADAFKKLSDKAGAAIDFGTGPKMFVPAALTAFQSNKTVDLVGITGALDFDTRGEVCSPIAAYKLDGKGGWTKTAVYTPACPDASGTWAPAP